jgi:hypothetical protein
LPNFPDIVSTPFSQVGKSSTARDDFGERACAMRHP